MALFIPKGCQSYWGEFVLNGKSFRVALGVKVRGKRPPTLKQLGDAAFERSRGEANAALEEKKREFTDPARAVSRLQRIHELSSGKALEVVHPRDLESIWLGARRPAKLSPKHIESCGAVFGRWANFMAREYPRIVDLRGVTDSEAEAFMFAEERREISNKTYNNIRGLLHAAFEAAKSKCGLSSNPFSTVLKKTDHTVHRRPYAPEEVAMILSAAKSAGPVGAVIICALCSGMRRENCVRLRWRDVDLQRGELQLEAFKTGEPLYVPLLPPLRELLEKSVNKGEYCFPEAVKEFERNPDGPNAKLLRLLSGLGFTMTSNVVAKGNRLRQPSVHGFHRFKTTYVTMALNGGIPIPMVQKVVGNQVVDIVIKHYYRPDKESIKGQFFEKLPTCLTGVKKDGPKDFLVQARAKLAGLDSASSPSVAEIRDLLDRAIAAG